MLSARGSPSNLIGIGIGLYQVKSAPLQTTSSA